MAAGSLPNETDGMHPRKRVVLLVLLALVCGLAWLGGREWRERAPARSAGSAGERAVEDPAPVPGVALAATSASEARSSPAVTTNDDVALESASTPVRVQRLVRGRAVDEAHLPLRERELYASSYSYACLPPNSFAALSAMELVDLQTDAEGRFEFQLEDALEPAVRCHELALGSRGGSLADMVHGRCLLPRGEGAIDLGDVVLALPHVIANGIVVDEHGAPIPGATVWARQSGGQRALDVLRGFVVGRVTREHGEFELLGWDEAAPMDLELECVGFENQRRERVELPARGLRIELHPVDFASLETELVLDPDLVHCALRVVAIRRDVPELAQPVPFVRSAVRNPRNVLIARPLEPGTYSVNVVDGATGVLLATIDDVHVRLGDASSNSIDLRGALRRVRVKTVTSRGEQLGEQSVEVLLEDGRRATLNADPTGWIELVRPLAAADLIAIDARGKEQRLSDGSEIIVHVYD